MKAGKRVMRIAAASVLLAALAACASIVQGSRQEVSIASAPTGARVTVDSTSPGLTPLVTELTRKHRHTIRIEMDGYQPYELITTRGTSGWVWGNIIFGGLIGLVVDASTGALYEVQPETISGTLAANAAQISGDRDLLVVRVVLQPDPAWTKVGTLEPVK